MRTEKVKICQIIPGGDWIARYSEGNGEYFEDPVICFALVLKRYDGKSWYEVRPMSGSFQGISFCEDSSNFFCLVQKRNSRQSRGIR